MSKKSKTELEAELRILRKARATEGIVQVFLSLIRWGGISVIAICAYLAINSLAGKTTLTDIGIGVSLLSDIKITVLVAWVFGLGGVAYGLAQRKLRRDNIERLQGQIKILEQTIDSKRSSSNLTQRGDTHPEDKI